VYCVGVSVIFLYGLSHVAVVSGYEMISESGSPDAFEKAPELYPVGGFRSSPDHECVDGLHYVLGAVSVRRVRGSSNVVASLGFHCKRELDSTMGSLLKRHGDMLTVWSTGRL